MASQFGHNFMVTVQCALQLHSQSVFVVLPSFMVSTAKSASHTHRLVKVGLFLWSRQVQCSALSCVMSSHFLDAAHLEWLLLSFGKLHFCNPPSICERWVQYGTIWSNMVHTATTRSLIEFITFQICGGSFNWCLFTNIIYLIWCHRSIGTSLLQIFTIGRGVSFWRGLSLTFHNCLSCFVVTVVRCGQWGTTSWTGEGQLRALECKCAHTPASLRPPLPTAAYSSTQIQIQIHMKTQIKIQIQIQIQIQIHKCAHTPARVRPPLPTAAAYSSPPPLSTVTAAVQIITSVTVVCSSTG